MSHRPPMPIRRAGALAALLLLAAVGCQQAGIEFCQNSLRERHVSPDAQFEAVVFERDCGAGVPVATHVAVVPVNTQLAEAPGNVMAIDARVGVGVEWRAPGELVIRVPPGAPVTQRETSVLGIQVEYASTAAP